MTVVNLLEAIHIKKKGVDGPIPILYCSDFGADYLVQSAPVGQRGQLVRDRKLCQHRIMAAHEIGNEQQHSGDYQEGRECVLEQLYFECVQEGRGVLFHDQVPAERAHIAGKHADVLEPRSSQRASISSLWPRNRSLRPDSGGAAKRLFFSISALSDATCTTP